MTAPRTDRRTLLALTAAAAAFPGASLAQGGAVLPAAMNRLAALAGVNPLPQDLLRGLADALRGADVFIGLSAADAVSPEMVSSMAKDSIVFAMANPIPEIWPDVARVAGAAVVGTGRSDFPNQINNSLVFPGVFRGALDCHATRVTTRMKLAAANALAGLVHEPTPENIIPWSLDRQVAHAVSQAVIESA